MIFTEEYCSFPDESKSKLATFLSTGCIDVKDATRQDAKLFHSVSKRIRCDSLKSVSDEMADEVKCDLPRVEAKSTRTQFTVPVKYFVRDTPIRSAKSTGRMETGSYEGRSKYLQTYFLTVGLNSNKQSIAVAYNLKTNTIVQNDMKLKKGKYIKDLCSGYLEGAPYLFMIISSNGKQDKLKRYDIIENKWETCARPNRQLSNNFIVNLGDSIYCFGGETTDIHRFCIAENKWTVCDTLKYGVSTPVYTLHDGKLYIFEQKCVQIFTPSGGVTEASLSSFVVTGYAFSFRDKICIISGSSLTEFDPGTGSSIRSEFPSLSFRPLHAVFVQNESVFALITNTEGDFEIHCSSDLAQWKEKLSFSKAIQPMLTETIACDCPFAPFENYNESRRKRTFSKT